MDYSVLLIGDPQSPELATIRQSLRNQQCRAVADLAAAIGLLAGKPWWPDLVILLQNWPGEFDAAEFQSLRSLAPLARVINVLGSWCEGETRSGIPLPGTVRIYWHQWAARDDLDRQQLAEGHCPSWSLPVTATEEDRLQWLAEHDDRFVPGMSGGLQTVGVLTAERPMWEWLAETCRGYGYTAAWLRPPLDGVISGEMAAILWDRSGDRSEEAWLSAALAGRSRPLPVVALATFPRFDELQRLKPLGVTAVIGKPVQLDELHWHLQTQKG